MNKNINTENNNINNIKLKKYQNDFSLFIRENANKKYQPDYLPQKNLHIYAQLIFNNINSSLKACFPICYSISKKNYWEVLVRKFMKEYKCENQMFKDIPEQFLQWLNNQTHKSEIKKLIPVFFIELAHYEWIEMAISIAPDNNTEYKIIENLKTQNNYPWLSTNFVLSDAWTIVDYYYDVHLINKKYQPKIKKEQANYFLIFRDKNAQVKFIL